MLELVQNLILLIRKHLYSFGNNNGIFCEVNIFGIISKLLNYI